MRRRFVLLDRDGTLIEAREHLVNPSDVRIIANVAAALRRLREFGLGVVVLTNQSVVARRMLSEAGLNGVHARIEELLAREGASVDAFYHCPHMPETGCSCRKPAVGLVKQAARKLGFEPAESFVVGDQGSDVELARRIEAISFLVRTGYGRETQRHGTLRPDYIVDDLLEASRTIGLLVDSARQYGG